VYPLFLASSVAAIACTRVRGDRSAGLFYPHFVFIAAIILILRLLGWAGLPRLSQNRTDYSLRYRTRGSPVDHVTFALEEFGPTITAAEVENYQSFCLEVVQPSL